MEVNPIGTVCLLAGTAGFGANRSELKSSISVGFGGNFLVVVCIPTVLSTSVALLLVGGGGTLRGKVPVVGVLLGKGKLFSFRLYEKSSSKLSSDMLLEIEGDGLRPLSKDELSDSGCSLL